MATISDLVRASSVSLNDLLHVWRTAQGVDMSVPISTFLEAVNPDVADLLELIEEIEETIAPVEETTTASKAYAVGDKLFYNNILYNVTAAISSGGTLVVDTNLQESTDTIFDLLKTKANTSDLDVWTSTSTVSDGEITFSNLNDSYNYSKPFFEDGLYTVMEMTMEGSGSSMSLTFTTDAPDDTVGKLRIVK